MKVTEIQRRIQNAKDLDFGTLFNQSIELFKKTWVQGLVTLLLNMVLAIPVVMIIYIPLIFMGVFDAYGSSYDPYEPYSQPEIAPFLAVILFVVYVFAMAAMSAIGTGLKAAFYRICKSKDHDEIGKEDYFFFFKKPYLVKTIKLGLAIIGISFLGAIMYIIMFLTFIMSNDFESMANAPLLFLTLLPFIYLIVPITFIVVVYTFNPEKSITDIIKLSFKLGNKKWLITFGLIFVSGFLAGIVGMLMCCIGVYLTASFSYLPPYFIYKDVIGFDIEDETLGVEKNSTF